MLNSKPPRLVTDIEIHFATGEPAVFTCDATRGDEASQADNGERRYMLKSAPGVEEAWIFPDWDKVNYVRLTTRPAEDDEPEPAYLGGGVAVQGTVPEPPD